MAKRSTLVTEDTLTLPYGVLQTLHNGASEVRLYRDLVTQQPQIGKRVSLLGREDNLIHEAAFLSEASHRNIAEMYAVAEPSGQDGILEMIEIMMPYYEKGSVFDALVKRGERLAIEEVRVIMMRALRGLEYLHEECRVLHRDIKPANLFLATDDSVVKVGDFGEAMRMETDEACAPLLSPQFWTPPESFGGVRYMVSSEIYSMECRCTRCSRDRFLIQRMKLSSWLSDFLKVVQQSFHDIWVSNLTYQRRCVGCFERRPILTPQRDTSPLTPCERLYGRQDSSIGSGRCSGAMLQNGEGVMAVKSL
jgi:serine/threonine protein kinase